MAATGTGLPLQDRSPATVQPGGSPATFNGGDGGASDWLRIAASSEQLATTATHALGIEVHQAQVGYLADQNVEIARKRADLRDQYQGDPDGFDAAWTGYTEGKLQQAEPWAIPHVKKLLGSEGTAAYSALLGEKRAEDNRLDAARVDSLAKMAGDDVIGTAMAGTFNSPDGQAKLDKFRGVMATAVASKLIPQEEADRRIVDVTNRATAETLVKHIGDQYRTDRANGVTAGPNALKAAEDTILRNPDLPLSEDQRYAYYHKATAEIRALEAERKQDLQGAKAAMSDAMYAMARGVRVDPDTLDSISGQLNAAGGQADVAKLRAAAARSESMNAYGRLPLADQVTQYRAAASSATAASAPVGSPENVAALTASAKRLGIDPRDLAAAISYETGGTFDPNKVGGKGNNYLGLIQFGPEERAKYGVTPGMSFGQQMQAVESFLRDRGVTPGMGLSSIYRTINGGSPTVSLAANDGNGTIAEHVARIQASHYGAADKFLGGQGGAPSPPVAIAPGVDGRPVQPVGADFRLVSAQKTELDKSARQDWERISKDLDAGIRPTPAALNNVIQGFTLTGNHDMLENVGARLDRFDAKFAAGRAPQAFTEAAAHELTRIGETEGLSPGQSAWLKDLKAVNEATAQRLKDDPIGLAVERFPERFKTPAPLDASNSDNLRAGLQQRAQIAGFVSQNYQVPAVSALSPADLLTVKAALAKADPAGKARIYGDLTAGLPEDIRNQSLAQLTKDGHVASVEAYAGALAGQDAVVGQSILRGQAAIKTDKRFDPSEKKPKDFNDAIDKALPVSTFGLTSRTDATGAYATMKSAAKARYADLAAQAGDTSGDLNEERLRQAVTDVTGGVLNHNGGTLIAPRRGMSQSQFDGMIWRLGDADLPGVTTLSGAPVTASYLRDNARLESVGDGRYLVQLGKDPLKPIYAFQGANSEMPQPFVLNLKNRDFGPTPPVSIQEMYLQSAGVPVVVN